MPENENKVGNSFMTKLSTFIVDKRNLFFLLTIIMLIFSAFSLTVRGEGESYETFTCANRANRSSRASVGLLRRAAK